MSDDVELVRRLKAISTWPSTPEIVKDAADKIEDLLEQIEREKLYYNESSDKCAELRLRLMKAEQALKTCRNDTLDEAVKVVAKEYLGVSEQYEQDGFDLENKIKELKND